MYSYFFTIRLKMYQLRKIILINLYRCFLLCCSSNLFYSEILAQSDTQNIENQLEIAQKNGNKIKELQILQQLSNQYEQRQQFKKALNYAEQALYIAQGLNKINQQIRLLDKIGTIYANRGGYANALTYHQKSLELAKGQLSSSQLIQKLRQMGKLSAYSQQKKLAVQYLEQALQEAQKNKNIQQTFLITEELERICQNIGYTQKSLEYKALKANIAKQIEAQQAEQIAEDAAQMGQNYEQQLAVKQSQLYNVQGNLENAEALRKDIERESREKDLKLNQQRLRSQTQENLLKIKTLQVEQQRSKAEHEETLQRAYLIILIVLIVLVIGALYAIRSMRIKNKELFFLYQQLENKQKDINDSISYAQRIQEAVLPSKTYINELFPENFIFFKPKDVVSGDFYWAGAKNGLKFIVVSDCTGHGVPGAFMSILGISLLNSIALNRNITKPNAILDELGDAIIKTLRQNAKNYAQSGSKDGMDIVVCAVDEQNDELHFAGAFNPLLFVRNQKHGNTAIVNNTSLKADKVQSGNNHLYQIKGNRQPAGVHRKPLAPFTLHTLKLVRGDTIYLISDGYVDQFGGVHNKKYMIKNFKKLLCEIQHMGMTEQYIQLKQELLNWQGDYAQIDDICVIGFRY